MLQTLILVSCNYRLRAEMQLVQLTASSGAYFRRLRWTLKVVKESSGYRGERRFAAERSTAVLEAGEMHV